MEFIVDSGNQYFSTLNGVLFDINKTTLIAYPAKKDVTNYIVPNSVRTIAANAFYYSKLKSITLPDSIETIGNNAFYKCSSLTSVTIPSSVASITCRVNGDTIVDDGDTNCQTFSNCSALVSIEVDAANPNFSSTGGILFDKLQTTLIQYPPGKVGTYTIPANVSSIWPLAFDRCNGLPSISVDA